MGSIRARCSATSAASVALSGELIGRMLIKDVYSFIDIEPDHFEQVKNSFNNANYKGRTRACG
jgi:hypothetical protein